MPTLYINAGMTGSGKSKINTLIKELHKGNIEELILDDYVMANSYYKSIVRPILTIQGLNKCTNENSCISQLNNTFYDDMFKAYRGSRNTNGCKTRKNINRHISIKDQHRVKNYNKRTTNMQLSRIHNPVNEKSISNKLRLLNKTRYKSKTGCSKIFADKLFLALLDDKNIIVESVGRSVEDITWIFYYIPIHYNIEINFVLFTDINELYKRIFKRGFDDSKQFLSLPKKSSLRSSQLSKKQVMPNYPAPRFPKKYPAIIYEELVTLIQNTIKKTMLYLKNPSYPPTDVSNLKRIDTINIYDTTKLAVNIKPREIKPIAEIDFSKDRTKVDEIITDLIQDIKSQTLQETY